MNCSAFANNELRFSPTNCIFMQPAGAPPEKTYLPNAPVVVCFSFIPTQKTSFRPKPLPVFPPTRNVISTEAAHGLIVSSAAEKSASLPQPFTIRHRALAVVLAFARSPPLALNVRVSHPSRALLSSLMTCVTDCPGTCVTFLLWLEDLLPSAARSCSAGQQDRFRASRWSRRRP